MSVNERLRALDTRVLPLESASWRDPRRRRNAWIALAIVMCVVMTLVVVSVTDHNSAWMLAIALTFAEVGPVMRLWQTRTTNIETRKVPI